MALPVLAAEETVVIKPKGEFGNIPSLTVDRIVQGVINVFLIGAALIFFFMLVLGGIKWIMSEGDEGKVKSARDQVQNALVGLVIVFAAWAILRLIGSLFGIDLTGALTFPTF